MTARRFLLSAATFAGFAALPPAVQAQPVNGLYIGGAAGVNWKMDQSFSAPFAFSEQAALAAASSDKINGNAGYNVGYGLLGSVGWGFGNGLRAEVEGNFRSNGVNNASVNGFGNINLNGSVRTYGMMANLLFDMNIGQSWIYPYIGGGVGYAWTNMDNVRPSGSSGASLTGASLTGTSGNFAYQAMLGAAFPIAAVPGLALTAEYRFMGVAGDTHFSAKGDLMPATAQVNGNGNSDRVSVSNQYNHALMLGVRYAFGAPPAPVPVAVPAPVAAPARSFLVFFDWDKFNLTDRARGVIRDAATAAKSMQHTVIEVNGYADTSGSPSYNMPLSMKRAQAVAGELVRNGVGKNEIAIKAFGDTVLLVPTGAGVREPQNRRVEIIIK